MLKQKLILIRMIIIAAFFVADIVRAEYVVEINEAYAGGKTSGQVNGGTWTSEGWKTRTRNDYIQFDIKTCPYGRIEFDVKGLYASAAVFPNVDEKGEENMHYSLFTMWDRDINDAWYGKYPNGIQQWHNPWKMVAHIFGYVAGDPWKWQHGRFRLNVGAYWGGYEDDPHAFEVDYGPVPWQKDKVFHVKVEWGQGHMYYYIDDILYTHADYSSFGTEYAPPYHSMRLGSALGCKGISKMQAPLEITYLNFRFSRNEDLTPPEVVSFSPGNNSQEIPLDSYIAVSLNESIDPTTTMKAVKILPPVDSQVKLTGNTLYFELSELLRPSTQYTVHVSTELKDFAGNNLTQPFEATFTTRGSGDPVIEKYGIFELPIVAKGVTSNKYKDVTLRGVFRGPTKTIEIDGFWNGGDIWKVRMAPIEVGTWTYSISGSRTEFTKSGSFKVVDSNRKGFIRQNPDHPFTFMWDDGTPWLWKGETSWRAYTQLLPFESRFKEYIDLRASQGFNAVQSIVVSYINGDAFWANEGGTAFELNNDGKNYDRLNPGYYQWIDRRIEYANSKGIVPVIFFTWAQEFVKFSDAQFRKFAEYMVSRWAGYNVIWCISGEYNEVYDEYGLAPSVYRQHGNTVYSKDPYKHLISLHPSGRGTSHEFVYDKWFGFSFQQWPIEYHKYILEDRSSGSKPVVNGEYAYADYHDNEDVRRGAWDIFTAGGFFTAGFFHTFAPDKGGWDPASAAQPQKELKLAMEFMGRTEWWDMNPHDELVTNAYCLADPGDEYVVYSRNGGSTTINLSAVKGETHVQWLNPKTGEYSVKNKIQGGGSLTLTPPFAGEWVLHVGSKFDSQAPAPPGGFVIKKP